MSSYGGGGFAEWLSDSIFKADPSDEEVAALHVILAPYQADIEIGIDGFEPDSMSWRDYRNGLWERVPKEASDKVAGILKGTILPSDILRPAPEEIAMRMALLTAKRSTCLRLQVGTVITSTDFRKVLAFGYNGNASGLPNHCDRTGEEAVGFCGCLHSEENAIINCDVPRTTEKLVFVTHLPCKMCSKRLVNLGNVRKVYYGADYRIRDGAVILENCGIVVEKLSVVPPEQRAISLLRELEWTAKSDINEGGPACISCREKEKDGHARHCGVGGLLLAYPENKS